MVIYDISGSEVQTLVLKSQAPRTYQLNWDGTNREGKQVSGGMYFARIRAGAPHTGGVQYSSVVEMVYLP